MKVIFEEFLKGEVSPSSKIMAALGSGLGLEFDNNDFAWRDEESTHHVSGVSSYAVFYGLDSAVRESHAVAAGHHACFARLLLVEVQAFVISHGVAVSGN